tara:strand:+ start:449 stop:1513 length:1065 start_codon:yes stop_codon:yes gene_type:complete
MKVCIIGDGIVSLTLANALTKEGIFVDVYSNKKIKNINKSRTLGISKDNINFFNNNILNIQNLLWRINKIEIYSENLKKEKILNFENEGKELFSIIKNHDLYNLLEQSLSDNTFFKKKKNYKKINPKNYKLVINCDSESFFSKKYFYKKIEKNYNSFAFTSIIQHEKIDNNTAVQIFTKKGPLAFLPISKEKTSVVYSVRNLNEIDLLDEVKKYNIKYKIKKMYPVSSFGLIASNLRTYHHKNILAFGDLLHKLHPLAGQGFNMTIRDINLLLDLVKFNLSHGLEINNQICLDFENKNKHKNYLFSNGIDFFYEFFNFESKTKNTILSKSIQFVGKNKYFNKFFTNLADKGIVT